MKHVNVEGEKKRDLGLTSVMLGEGRERSVGLINNYVILLSTGTKLVGYNRMRFLIESLMDLDFQLKGIGGPGLLLMRGTPVDIFRTLWKELGISKICFEQDCEPIYKKRDDSVKGLCQEVGMQFYERISHTLWDPKELIRVIK